MNCDQTVRGQKISYFRNDGSQRGGYRRIEFADGDHGIGGNAYSPAHPVGSVLTPTPVGDDYHRTAGTGIN
jgi:hypothetical protein